MGRNIAFISEEYDSVWDETRHRGDEYWVGTFYGHVEDGAGVLDEFEHLSLADAIAWARERTDDIQLRIGAGDYIDPPDPVPALTRRRHESETWKDRTSADPPVPWNVRVGAGPDVPPGEYRSRREELDAIAGAAGAGHWNRRRIDEFLADWGDGTGFYTTYGALTYEFYFDGLRAATEDEAVAAAKERLTLPDDWRVGGDAEPVRPGR